MRNVRRERPGRIDSRCSSRKSVDRYILLDPMKDDKRVSIDTREVCAIGDMNHPSTKQPTRDHGADYIDRAHADAGSGWNAIRPRHEQPLGCAEFVRWPAEDSQRRAYGPRMRDDESPRPDLTQCFPNPCIQFLLGLTAGRRVRIVLSPPFSSRSSLPYTPVPFAPPRVDPSTHKPKLANDDLRRFAGTRKVA
jgi:hypothetical protein